MTTRGQGRYLQVAQLRVCAPATVGVKTRPNQICDLIIRGSCTSIHTCITIPAGHVHRQSLVIRVDMRQTSNEIIN